MKLDQLRYFQEACKYGSISVAAEKNFISQPTFSSSITKLERELNVTLLNRNSRGVSPTETGKIILDKIQDMFTLVNDIESVAYSHSAHGVVQLATIPCMCDLFLPLAVKAAKEQALPLNISIHCAESHEIYHQVLSGLCSLGIIFAPDENHSSEIIYTPLFDDEYVVYVGPHSPYWDADSITIEEAMQQPYIAYRQEFIRNNGGVTDFFKGMTPNIVLRTDELESIKKMITIDNYVAFYHRFMTCDDVYIKAGLIRALPISNFDAKTHIGVIESTKYKPTAADRAFLTVLKEAVTAALGPNSGIDEPCLYDTTK